MGDDEPLTRREAGAAAAARLGQKRPFAIPGWMLKVSGQSDLLTKSLRVSNAKFKEATGWQPAHPSLRDSWPVVR